jgi:hypothetical protein
MCRNHGGPGVSTIASATPANAARLASVTMDRWTCRLVPLTDERSIATAIYQSASLERR